MGLKCLTTINDEINAKRRAEAERKIDAGGPHTTAWYLYMALDLLSFPPRHRYSSHG